MNTDLLKAKGDERYIKILQLQSKNATVYMTVGSLQLVGGVLAVYWASKKNWSLLGKVGAFFGGVILTGVPLGIATRQGIVNRNLEIERIKQELEKEQSK